MVRVICPDPASTLATYVDRASVTTDVFTSNVIRAATGKHVIHCRLVTARIVNVPQGLVHLS